MDMNEEGELTQEQKLAAEQKELNILNNVGFEIKTKLFGKDIFWKVGKIPMGIMDYQSLLFFKLKSHQDQIQEDNFQEVLNLQYNSVADNAKICAEIIAITILGKPWKIKLFTWWLKRHLYWNIDSKELLDFTQKILNKNDYQSFTTSIVLLSATRVTNPETIEKTV